jgi:hypothetical protein
MIDTSLFTVPIIPLPRGGMMHTPPSVPVVFEGEHVADAVHRGSDYVFRMFRGNLQHGLSTGKFLIQPKYKDVAGPGTATHRLYLAVEIVPRLETVE